MKLVDIIREAEANGFTEKQIGALIKKKVEEKNFLSKAIKEAQKSGFTDEQLCEIITKGTQKNYKFIGLTGSNKEKIEQAVKSGIKFKNCELAEELNVSRQYVGKIISELK